MRVWNPLKQEIKPGQTLLIKPNMVMEENHIKKEVAPSPKNIGVIAMGKDQVIFDEATVSLMKYDKIKISFLVNARNVHGKYKLCTSSEAINYEIVSNIPSKKYGF